MYIAFYCKGPEPYTELSVPETKKLKSNVSKTKESKSYSNSNMNQEVVIYFSGGELRIVGQE